MARPTPSTSTNRIAWLKFANSPDIFYARIDPDAMFTFRMVDKPTLP